ncbi:MAG: hypothetical protein MJ238_05385 [Bacilli bacterium]|nr:hypothetical protein [Bacilli bacterium]
MKKTTQTKTTSLAGKVGGLASALLSIIAIFTMFAPAFNEEEGNARGNLFQVMFGNSWKSNPGNYNPVWPLIIGFALLVIAVFLGFAIAALEGKAKKALTAGALVANAGAIALTMFECQFYYAANADHIVSLESTGVTYIGAAAICVAIFAGIAVVINFFSLIYKGEAE